jgi:tetratricopeptide (TPR) repeat protein
MGLRKFGFTDLCPLCRAGLPPGPAPTRDEGVRLAVAAEQMQTGSTLQHQRYAEAVVLLRQSLAEDSSVAGAQYALGKALEGGCKDAEIDAAEAAYRAAICIDPKLADAHYNLGVLLKNERRDIDGAEEAYRMAICIDPKNAKAALCNLGGLLQTDRKDIDGAEAAFRAAICIDPKNAIAHLNLGMLLHTQRKDIDDAEAAYRAVIRIDPKHAKALCNLGVLLANERKDTGGAEAALRAAIAADRT